jgi:predicted SnoaL-like aldol condensation-catalyzing enzyme
MKKTKSVSASVVSSHKEAARSFLHLVASGHVKRAFDSLVSPRFIHHNPHFAGDATSLAAGMEENAAQNPDKILEIERVIEEGDLVAVHTRVRQKPEDPDFAVVHVFRFEGDRIAELWDVAQQAPASSPNENGMF